MKASRKELMGTIIRHQYPRYYEPIIKRLKTLELKKQFEKELIDLVTLIDKQIITQHLEIQLHDQLIRKYLVHIYIDSRKKTLPEFGHHHYKLHNDIYIGHPEVIIIHD